MMEMKKRTVNNISPRELPPSSYQVIQLPTKSPSNKESPVQKQDVKRRKVMPSATSHETSQPVDFQPTLNVPCPSFTKTLSKSHVSGWFFMGLPLSFCRMHLPVIDTSFLLEYESKKQYEVKYLAERTAFSGGWREFSMSAKLSEGDELVFQLENPTKFKVHRVKQGGLSEENGPHVALNLGARVEQNGTYGTALEKIKEKHRATSYEAVPRDEDHEVDNENFQKGMPSVTRQADESRSTLNSKYPSFTRKLTMSNISDPFSMALPRSFCKTYLNPADAYVILENENGKRSMVKYVNENTEFSGKWKEFVLSENLCEGEVLVFQLLSPKRFKVHRVKQNGPSEVNGTPVALNLDARVDRSATHGGHVTTLDKSKEKPRASSSETVFPEEDHAKIPSEEVEIAENAKNNTLELSSGNSKRLGFSPTASDWNAVTTFDNFAISLDESLKQDNFTLPHHIKWSYYQLCSSQKSVLHADIYKGANRVLVAGCIIETVDIANAMKSCELLTFDSNFEIWDEKLKRLEGFGMNVRFLSARLQHLKKIVGNSDAAKTKQKYKDLCSEHVDIEKMIKSLEDKLTELRRVSEKHTNDMEKLNSDVKEHELRFQEQVSAPW